jgi:protein phosphatase
MGTTGTILAAVATDVGRVRDHNEDAGLVTPHLVAVADGMGGHAAGEVAAELAVDTLRGLGASDDLRPRDVVAAVLEGNRAILESAARNPAQTGMATTLATLARVTVGGAPHWAVVNIGDSRVYRVVDGRLTQVSQDHSTPPATSSRGASGATRWSPSTPGCFRRTRGSGSSCARTG